MADSNILFTWQDIDPDNVFAEIYHISEDASRVIAIKNGDPNRQLYTFKNNIVNGKNTWVAELYHNYDLLAGEKIKISTNKKTMISFFPMGYSNTSVTAIKIFDISTTGALTLKNQLIPSTSEFADRMGAAKSGTATYSYNGTSVSKDGSIIVSNQYQMYNTLSGFITEQQFKISTDYGKTFNVLYTTLDRVEYQISKNNDIIIFYQNSIDNPSNNIRYRYIKLYNILLKTFTSQSTDNAINSNFLLSMSDDCNIIYAAVENNYNYFLSRSKDGGKTWTNIITLPRQYGGDGISNHTCSPNGENSLIVNATTLGVMNVKGELLFWYLQNYGDSYGPTRPQSFKLDAINIKNVFWLNNNSIFLNISERYDTNKYYILYTAASNNPMVPTPTPTPTKQAKQSILPFTLYDLDPETIFERIFYISEDTNNIIAVKREKDDSSYLKSSKLYSFTKNIDGTWIMQNDYNFRIPYIDIERVYISKNKKTMVILQKTVSSYYDQRDVFNIDIYDISSDKIIKINTENGDINLTGGGRSNDDKYYPVRPNISMSDDGKVIVIIQSQYANPIYGNPQYTFYYIVKVSTDYGRTFARVNSLEKSTGYPQKINVKISKDNSKILFSVIQPFTSSSNANIYSGFILYTGLINNLNNLTINNINANGNYSIDKDVFKSASDDLNVIYISKRLPSDSITDLGLVSKDGGKTFTKSNAPNGIRQYDSTSFTYDNYRTVCNTLGDKYFAITTDDLFGMTNGNLSLKYFENYGQSFIKEIKLNQSDDPIGNYYNSKGTWGPISGDEYTNIVWLNNNTIILNYSLLGPGQSGKLYKSRVLYIGSSTLPVTPTPTKTKAPTSIAATPTRTKIAITPTRTPTGKINQNIILPLTNYNTDNANIYSPYTRGSKIVCLFNEPDGFFTNIKNEIPTIDNISYLQADESVISNKTLVPKTVNSTFSTIELNNLFNQYYNSNFTIEYYFYLNNDKITTIYNGYGYAENVSVGSNLVEWKLIYDPSKGLIYDRPTSITNLNITLRQGWYHFAVSTYDANFRYFINGQSIFPNHSINQMTVSTVKPYFKSYVDKLDSLRVSDEGLYSGPFTVLPHNQNPGVTPTVTRTPSSTKPGNAVTNIVATGGNECIHLKWNIPEKANGLLGYKIYYNYYSVTNSQFVPALNGDMLNPIVTSAVITNLPNDTGYQVQIRIDAVYSNGTTYSTEVMQYTDVSKTIPNSPILTLTNPLTSATAVLTWTPPVNQSIGNFNWRNELSLLIYNSNGVLEFQSDYQSNFNSYTVSNKNGKYSFEISARYVNDFDRSIAPIYVKSNRVTKTLNAVVTTSTPTPTNTVTPTVTPTTTPIILPEFFNISLQENNFNKSNNYFNLAISSISSNYPVLSSDSYDIEINGPYPFDDILHVASLQSNSATEDIITQPWTKTETRTANTLSDKIYITPAILGIYYVRIKRLVSNTYSNIQTFFRSFDIIEVPPTPTVTPTITNTPTVTNTPSVTPQINPTPTRTPTKAIPGLTSIPTSTPSQTPTRTPFVPKPINELDYTTAQIGVRDSVAAGYSLDCVIYFNKPISYSGQTWEKLFLTFNGNHIKALYDNENLPKTHRVYTTTEGFFQTFTSNVLGLHQLKNITLTIESQNNNRYLWIVTAQYDKNTAGISTPMYAAGTVLNFEILLDYSQGKKTNATLVASRATSPYPYSVWEYSYDPSQFLIDFDINVNAISIPVTPTVTPTISLTPTNTQTNTPTNTSTPSATVTLTPTNIDTSVTRTPTPTNTITSTNTATPTITATPTVTPSTSAVPSLNVYSAGDNIYGQLSNPFVGSSLEFTKIDDRMIAAIQQTQTSEIKEVSCGNFHTCFITNNGNVYSVGRNAQGQLGRLTPTTSEQIAPGKVIFPGSSSSPFVQVSCGASHTFALNSKGELYSWGNNTNGQLSLGDNIDRPTPVLVSGMINGAPSDPGVWKYVSCGLFHTLAINISGELYACGLNTDGQLGLSDNRDRLKLRKVTVDGNWVSAVGGGYHTLALNSAGQLYSCGNNSKGQLGAGTVGVNTNVLGLSNSNITKISAGLYHSVCLINSSPTEVCGCGENSFNQISNAFNNYQPSPSVVGWRAMTFYGTEISCGYNHTLILKNDNLLYGCGDNSKGQLGIPNNTSNNNRITQIGDNNVVRKLANKQGSTHSLIFIDQGSTISLPPTPTRSNTPTPTPTKRPPGSTATATPTNSVTPTATPTPSKAPSIILQQSSKTPDFDIISKYDSYEIVYKEQLSQTSSSYKLYTIPDNLFSAEYNGTKLYERSDSWWNNTTTFSEWRNSYTTHLTLPRQIINSITDKLFVIYDDQWNYITHINPPGYYAETYIVESSIRYVRQNTFYNSEQFYYQGKWYTAQPGDYVKTATYSRVLGFPLSTDISYGVSSYNIVMYQYELSGSYDLQSIVRNYLNKTTADNGYNSLNVKLNSLGWYNVKNSTPYTSPISSFVGRLSSSVVDDYIIVLIAGVGKQFDTTLTLTDSNGVLLETQTSKSTFKLEYKTNQLGNYYISTYITDIYGRTIRGESKTLNITSIAPNPIGYVPKTTSTATPTPTTTPSITPTSAARTIISPISNYVPGNTTIYTPYKTSGAVCIFNEPDGSDYIRNQINDPAMSIWASTSNVMGNCLVPRVPNPIADSIYETLWSNHNNSTVVPNFTIEYYFYLDANKRTTIYSSHAFRSYAGTSTRVDWSLIYYNLSGDSSLKGLVSHNAGSEELKIILQTGWYHFAVSFDKGEFRYFINGKQLRPVSRVLSVVSTDIYPNFKTYVDKLDALRITKESLYYVPFTTLPHM